MASRPIPAPDYLVYATDVEHDEAVDYRRSHRALRRRYCAQLHPPATLIGPKSEVGHHGTLAEYPVWHQAALDFKTARDARYGS